MAKQVINFGTTINDGTGDSLRNGAQKINSNFTELYELLGGSESISIVTKITAGPGLVASSPTGDITISTLPATDTQQGLVTIGSGIDVDDAGVISVTPYSLPKAATNILGGIRVGDNLTINNDGVLSAVATPYSLPTASPTVKGGVKIGNGLEIVDSVLNVTTSEIAAALQSGAVTVQLEDDGDVTGRLKASGPLIVLAGGQESNDNYVQLQWTQDRDNPDLVKSNYLWLDTNGISLSTTNPVETEFLPLYSNTLFYNTQGTLTFNDLGQVGPVQSPDGIDLYAPEGMEWTQLNYGNRNYVWVSATGAFIDLSPDTNPANSKQWEFNLDTSTVLPGSIEIKGNTTVALAQFNQLQADYNLKLAEVNDLVSQLASKYAEQGYWQGIIESGPLNPLYGQAVSNNSALILEIADLESASNMAQSELIAIANNLNAIASSLASPSVTLTYVVEDGVLDINQGAVRFPDGTIQTTAYLGTALPEIVVDRLTNGEFEVILGVDGTLTVDGTIYSASNMSVESITDTSITAGTDLKLYSSGLFALRNYSIEDDIVISTGYNSEDEKNWLFGTDGGLTFPDNTVQTTAYNITNRSDNSSSILAVGDTMTREWLTVQITVANSTELVVEFNYANPEASVTLSGNNGTTNFFNGDITVLAGNVIYYPITTTPLAQVGDLVTAIIADHSYGKVYRITAMYRDIPSEGTLGSVYCTIEQLM
jgi:hypothetical protein